jgi:hypothetical protein
MAFELLAVFARVGPPDPDRLVIGCRYDEYESCENVTQLTELLTLAYMTSTLASGLERLGKHREQEETPATIHGMAATGVFQTSHPREQQIGITEAKESKVLSRGMRAL